MNIEGRIAKYFSLKEMANNLTSDPIKLDLSKGLDQQGHMMDELREWYGKPMEVNSWYREKEFNKSVNGDPNSCHLSGIASDIAMLDITKEKAELYAEIWRSICIRYGVIGGVSIYLNRKFMHFDSNNDPDRYGKYGVDFRKQYF